MLDLLQAGEQTQNARDPDVRDERGRRAQVLERAPRLLRNRDVGRPGGDDGNRAFDVRHGLADREVKRCRARVVASAAGQRFGRHLFPLLRQKTCDQNVMGPRELAADLGDLSRRFASREDDLGEADAAQTVKIERVVGALHAGDSIRARRWKTGDGRRETENEGKAVLRLLPKMKR